MHRRALGLRQVHAAPDHDGPARPHLGRRCSTDGRRARRRQPAGGDGVPVVRAAAVAHRAGQRRAGPQGARPAARRTRARRAAFYLDKVGLDGYEEAYPAELSGGMKQRAGLARALAVEPELLFMDEPFAGLDPLTSANLREEVLTLWSDHDLPVRTVVMVTHIIEEAVLMADRVVVLSLAPGPRGRRRADPARAPAQQARRGIRRAGGLDLREDRLMAAAPAHRPAGRRAPRPGRSARGVRLPRPRSGAQRVPRRPGAARRAGGPARRVLGRCARDGVAGRPAPRRRHLRERCCRSATTRRRSGCWPIRRASGWRSCRGASRSSVPGSR